MRVCLHAVTFAENTQVALFSGLTEVEGYLEGMLIEPHLACLHEFVVSRVRNALFAVSVYARDSVGQGVTKAPLWRQL